MAITELFVDPSIAGDNGAGTVGNPYGDLQYLHAQETFDTVNGTRINIKAGTAEILAAGLDLASNFIAGGGPSATAPLIYQGYASAADDGDWTAQTGIGGIDCNNNEMFAVGNQSYISLRHLEIFNRAGAGYNRILYLGSYCHILECEIHTHSGASAMILFNGLACTLSHCHIHGISVARTAVRVSNYGIDKYNYFDLGSSATLAIELTQVGAIAQRNILRLTGATDGIAMLGHASRSYGNSIWSNGGTGQAIRGNGHNVGILNNVAEGFRGAGGVGIEKTSGIIAEYGGNHCYDNTDNYNVTVTVIADYGDNEDLSGSSPFTDAANEDMTPVDVGNMKEGAWPPSIVAGDGGLTAAMKMWKGALEPAGGGRSVVGGVPHMM